MKFRQLLSGARLEPVRDSEADDMAPTSFDKLSRNWQQNVSEPI